MMDIMWMIIIIQYTFIQINFDAVNVEGRDVLTVLGSGDQALYMYDRGAKSVYLFDKNNLTLYYYYLRVWTIEYLNEFYP